MLKNLTSMKKYNYFVGKILGNLSPSLSCFATRYLWQFSESSGYESGIIRTQMGTHNRSENGPQCMGRLVRYHTVTVTETVSDTPKI
jgi:hypothetical protein